MAADGAAEAVDLDFGADGLVPVIAQDAETDEVLMLAHASPEAVERTHETGLAHYYSRSRDELWKKGGSSGHTQTIEEIRVDCDGDALLYRVDQTSGACHTGFRSCFHRRVEDVDRDGDDATARVTVDGDHVFDPDEVYDDG